MSLFDRFADAGAADPDAVRFWSEIFRQHRRDPERSIFELALLPQTAAAWRVTRSAAALRDMRALEPEQPPEELHFRLRRFAERGLWQRTRDQDRAPEACTPFEKAAFAFLKARGRDAVPSLSALRRMWRP